MRASPLLVAISIGFSSSVAFADDLAPTKDAYPLAYTSRPLTLPKGMLAPEVSANLAHVDNVFLVGAVNVVGLTAGATYGVIDNLNVYATPLTMSIVTSTRTDPTVYYGTLRLGAVYRFLHTEVADIGAQIEVGGGATFNTLFATAKLPVLLRLGHIVRIDTGLAFTGLFPTDGRPVDAALSSAADAPLGYGARAGIPVTVSVQATDHFYLGVDTGFGIGSFRGRDVSHAAYMPLGAFVGGTLGGTTPIVDITGSFSWPLFLLGGATELPISAFWVASLNARFYLQL
jgi:hypothetical protein